MPNIRADFPPDRFAIHAYCECGNSTRLPIESMPDSLAIDVMRKRLRCAICGGRDITIRIGWTAAGGFAHSGSIQPQERTLNV